MATHAISNDPLSEWEESRKVAQAQQQSDKAPFFFILKDGQRALVQFLLDYRYLPKTTLPYHKLYDNATKAWIANNVCAEATGQACALCAQAKQEGNRKLQARKVTFIPVYVHSIKERRAGEWLSVTYTGDDGEAHPVSGFRMIDTPFASSSILDSLALAFADSSDELSERTILGHDFILGRNGAGLDTTYTLSLSQRKPLPVPPDVLTCTFEQVQSDVELHRPMKMVEAVDVEEESAENFDKFAPNW